MPRSSLRFWRRLAVGCFPLLTACLAGAAEPAGATVQDLVEQNRRLQQQVQAQQRVIDDLTAKVAEVLQASDRHETELRGLRENAGNITSPAVAPAAGYQREKEVRISGEVGLAFLSTGSAGSFPKATFRADDAKIFIEAPVVRDVYFYGELALATRETQVTYLQAGELYVDFENISGRLGGPERLLSIRAGQINTPFGEEYAVRGPLANPLISHSLSDVWGIDGGIEAYGAAGDWQYAIAVQNGSVDLLHDHNADKAVTARLSWAPAGWLSLSASAMRTGELKAYTDTAAGDNLSNIWFGNGFFRAIGPSATTSTFWANLWEGDARVRWRGGQAAAAVGGVRYADNDRAADNSRRLSYGFIEGMQDVTPDLYLAARYSEISAPRGYPLGGWGNLGKYFFSPLLSTGLERLSLGFGYRFGPPLVVKFEFARESGRLLNGSPRNHEDFFGAEAALKF
jgi:hypothetical protein